MAPPSNHLELQASIRIKLQLLRAAQLLESAGHKGPARHLALTPVQLEARLACVFRSVRAVENSALAGWARQLLGPSQSGSALEAVLLVRLGAIAVLSSPEREIVWLDKILERQEYLLRRWGIEPQGTAEDVERALQEDVERALQEDGEDA